MLRGSGVPAAGLVPITLPTATVSLDVGVDVTWKPAPTSVARAVASSWPDTSGTGIAGSRATATATVGAPAWGSFATGAPTTGYGAEHGAGWLVAVLLDELRDQVRLRQDLAWRCHGSGPTTPGTLMFGPLTRERDEPALHELASLLRVLAEHEVGCLLGGLVVGAGDLEPHRLEPGLGLTEREPGDLGDVERRRWTAAAADVGLHEEHHDERDEQRHGHAHRDDRAPSGPSAAWATGARRGRGRGRGDDRCGHEGRRDRRGDRGHGRADQRAAALEAEEVAAQVLRRLVALVDVLRHRGEHDAVHRAGHVGFHRRRRRRRLAHVLVRDRHRAVGGERRDAGEHLVEHDAERVHVGAAVEREALRLLG